MYSKFLAVLFLLIGLNGTAYLYFNNPHPRVLAETDTITVSAFIDGCPLIYITPENRIPPVGNDSLEIDVEIRPAGSLIPIYTTTVTTDNDGFANLCPAPIGLGTSFYDVAIKGLSHLRRNFQNRQILGIGVTLDLRDPVLFAGDSHPTEDNYVNSLDISYEILNIYTNNLRADLNRDTIVNSLEFPTLLSHLNSYGDD